MFGSGPHAGAWKLSAGVLLAPLALAAPLWAKKQTAQRHPLVLPRQSLSYMPQLNGSTGFSVICLSQVPDPGTGSTNQTAVVDLSPPAGATSPAGSFPLFMFPQDVPAVQQLNGGMMIQTTAIIPVQSGAGKQTQVAQVSVTAPGQSQTPTAQSGCLFVCPVPSLPLLGQLNPGLTFNVLCTSQAGGGKGNPASQTALLDVQPTHGIVDPSQPLPMMVPVDTLPMLGQLNTGSIIDVTEVWTTPLGNSAVLPVALINVTQNEQSLSASNSGSGGNGDDEDDDGEGHGKGKGKDKGKGNNKDHGKDD